MVREAEEMEVGAAMLFSQWSRASKVVGEEET